MKIIKTKRWLPVVFLLAAVIPIAANADHQHDGQHDGGHAEGRWHGDIRHFHDHDYARWHGGHWTHGYHDGYWGWWWVVTGLWYFYPQPIYPYPDPYTPPVVTVPQSAPSAQAPAAPPQYWYYCEAAKEYYPYVPTCPGGWRTVPATPSDAPAR